MAATAEVELMIAEKSFRGGGRGKEAALLLMRYGVLRLKVRDGERMNE